MSNEKKQINVHEAAKDYLYPILKTVSYDAPISALDLERAFIAGFDYGILSTISDKHFDNLCKEVADMIAKPLGEGSDDSKSEI
jgi:hypothetical protein